MIFSKDSGSFICFIFLQFSKLRSPTESNESGRFKSPSKEIQCLNASFPIINKCSGKPIFFNAVQSPKAPSEIYFNAPGKVTLSKSVQYANAYDGIVSINSGITRLPISFLQEENAYIPIFLRDFDNTNFPSKPQFQKACAPISSIESGTIKSPFKFSQLLKQLSGIVFKDVESFNSPSSPLHCANA